MKMRWINFLPSIRMAPTLASFFFSKDLLLFSDESLVPWRRREGKRWNQHRVTFSHLTNIFYELGQLLVTIVVKL